MDYGIEGKVALVGGSSKGIGFEVAKSLAREGAQVALCGRTIETLESAAGQIREACGREVLAVHADLSQKKGTEQAVARVTDSLGPIDILVTNTGGPPTGKFFDFEDEDWDAAYALLLQSAISLIRAVVPEMREKKWGRIIGITSVSVKEPIEHLILSNVFRAGVTALFKSVAREVAADGITANTILPGLTDTSRLQEIYVSQAEAVGQTIEEYMTQVGSSLPLGRLTDPVEVAEAVVFLASSAASCITGSAIAADGGQLRGLL